MITEGTREAEDGVAAADAFGLSAGLTTANDVECDREEEEAGATAKMLNANIRRG